MSKQEVVHQWRVDLDGIAQDISTIFQSSNGVEAQRSAMLAKMWMGKLLGCMGEPDPYPHSRNPYSSVIEPTSDVGMGTVAIPLGRTGSFTGDPVAVAKELRRRLQLIFEQFQDAEIKQHCEVADLEWLEDIIRFIEQHIVEAGMWLGMVLGSMRVEEPAAEAVQEEALSQA